MSNGNLYRLITADNRFEECFHACMNCGICTAICPAAEFYDYDPRKICEIVQRHEEQELDALLRSDTIWYCGQCMSCKPRCPRGNVPGILINILRKVSQDLGYFTESKMGLQQYAIKETVAKNILEIGYCVHPDRMEPEMHPEQGPIWEWYRDHIEDMAPKFGANYNGDGPGALRKIREENMVEIRKIFKATGGMDLLDKVDKAAKEKTGIDNDDELFNKVYYSDDEE